jgi:hypothetical protein
MAGPRRRCLAMTRTKTIISQMSHLQPIIEPAVEAAGYKLVRLRVMAGRTKTL